MIDKQALEEFVNEQLADTDYFLVDVRVNSQNEIKVEIDSMENVDIDFCIDLSRKVEEAFDRDEEDYELEVGSAGLTSSFKVRRQYEKHMGDDVEVLAGDGKKYKGELSEVGEESFAILVEEKRRVEGQKKPIIERVPREFKYTDVKSVKYIFDF